MMKLYDVFVRDPRESRLANDGQAQIAFSADARSEQQLRAELTTFVCEGQYARALERIVSQYLKDLGSPRQKSAWVSGFFGSGKSHLLKMLGHMWVNKPFSDGSEPRALVPKLPDDVQAAFRELDTQARRMRKEPVAAAGTMLGGNDHVRETVLSVILRARGWPASYPKASFCFWLRDQGILAEVRSRVEREGRKWEQELGNLYVSPHIARALIEVLPGFASSAPDALKAVRAQFPQQTTDITTDEFLAAARKALSDDAELPPTILILDEVQQYINESLDRAKYFTDLAEAVQTRLDGRVMLVAAGQSALSSATPGLLWLRDRFSITVELTDTDVDNVIRKVLLKKQPAAIPVLEQMFERSTGEVERHLRGTRIGPRQEDRRDRILVQDYPLLPVRRRFWEACFRAVGAHGTYGQLRSQLRIIHDALHKMANEDVGRIIPVGDLFQSLAPSLVNTGFLLNEMHTRIQKQDDGTPDGVLRRDLCGLVFIISRLPTQEGVNLGVRADSATLADLTLPDLTQDSGPFRQRVSSILDELAESGTLMKIGEEYRLQTTAGAEWSADFQDKITALKQNEIEISTKRDELIARQLEETIAGIKLIQGESKVKRTIEIHIGNEAPALVEGHVTVWLMDGWNTSRKNAEMEARRLGQDSPTLVVFAPKKDHDALREAIIATEAARKVISGRGQPSTDEGREALEAMESRQRNAEATRDGIIREAIQSSVVFQGGGTEVPGESVASRLETAARSSLDRLFPRFAEADHRAWDVVIRRVRDGSEDALKAVGWERAFQEHPVAREVLAVVRTGARGSDILSKLRGSPYGWPDDAVAAILMGLHRAGHVKATRNGAAIGIGSLDQTMVKSADFRTETVVISAAEKIALRGLFNKAELKCKPGEEEIRAPQFLDAVLKLGRDAGGNPPLPRVPDTQWIEDMSRLSGGAQLAATLQARQRLEDAITQWGRLAVLRPARESAWSMAKQLHEHARGMPVAETAQTQLQGIEGGRLLLDDEDHVAPIITLLATSLRAELQTARKHMETTLDAAQKTLEADPGWAALQGSEKEPILRSVGLDKPPSIRLGTDAELLAALQERPLANWRELSDAVPTRVSRALTIAGQAAGDNTPAPTVVSIRRGTLPNEAAVREWLKEHEGKLREAVKKGPVIVD